MKLLVLACLIPVLSFSQTIPYRKYKTGETYRYRLTTEAYRADKLTGREVAISEHRVIKEKEIFFEEISWLSKTSYTGKDTISLDSVAKKVIPYRISLSPKREVPLPKLRIPEMVGAITDLNTFFVAISPALNVHKLSLSDSIYANEKPVKGNFGDSILILYGTDCIMVTQHLLSKTKKYTVVRTDFDPPSGFCLEPLLDTIAKKTFGQQNNFQMIRKGNGDKVNLLWGVESFSITTKLDSRNGQIIEATMTNLLTLRMRYNSSPDLKEYDVEMPISIKRNLKLELLKE